MATNRMKSLIPGLRRALLRDDLARQDGDLLEAFFSAGDEIAFEVLLKRHGPMVMGVCLRVLQNVHDAEDGFQATFLVLARKGNSLRKKHLLGNWLFGVAYRCALQIRSIRLRLRANEKQVDAMNEPAVEKDQGADLRPILDRELESLPEKYRIAVVLCDLEGRSRREVAQQLGVPEGTLSSRLATARQMLAKRLSRRGVSLSGGVLGALLVDQAQAAVPQALSTATIQAAVKLAAGQAVATLSVSVGAVMAFNGALKGMLLTKLKVLMCCLLSVAALASLLFANVLANVTDPSAKAVQHEVTTQTRDDAFAQHLQARPWTLRAIDRDKKTITISDKPVSGGGLTLIFSDPNPNTKPKARDQKGVKLEGLQVAKDVKVFINRRPATWEDLKNGMTVLLTIAPAKTQIAEIQVISQAREDEYYIEAIDLKKRTVTVRVNDKIAELPLARNARMETATPPGSPRPSIEGPVTELPRGTPVHLDMVMEDGRLAIQVLKVSQTAP